MLKIKGLRRRWLLNTVAIICVLGLICVFCITAISSTSFYSAMENDLRTKAEATAALFADAAKDSRDDLRQRCIAYTQSLRYEGSVQLQFICVEDGHCVASNGLLLEAIPDTQDVSDAMAGGGLSMFFGKDPVLGERVMAVSIPVMDQDGNAVGVFRFVSTTKETDNKIAMIGAISIIVLIVVLAAVLISGNYFIRSILIPLGEIIEKAKRITSGSYGIQIQTKYDDEVGDLAQTINEMSLKISENEKMQTDFISSLSHELRTPLTAITGWSETILGDEDLDENTARGVKIIHREAARMTEMVVELLDFTKIQDGRMTLNMELADIRAEFEDTIYMYGSRLSQEGIILEYQEDDVQIPEVSCDPKRLRQVFLNILDNAAKHGGEGKKIQVGITFEDDQVVVRIRDFGCGIPEDELPLVKKKFYKGSSKARGSGIGLAVCDEIVQLHGGSLTLENAQGGGTLATIRIPASQ